MKAGVATPLGYQEEGVELMQQFNGRSLLADEMGLGKTLQSLWVLQRNPLWWPALIVCPASVKYNWEFEASHHCGMRAAICEGRTPPTYNRHDLSDVPAITIINYDLLDDWEEYLKKLKFKTIVGDESQYLQSRTSKRTKAFKRLAKGCEHVLMLSGTPLMNKPADLFPTLNILWPEEYNSFWSYAQEYCDPKWKPWGWNYNGASNLDRLHTDLKQRGMIRRLKKDVLKDLPGITRRVMPIPMSDDAEYRKASTDFMSWLQINHAHKMRAASRAEKLMQVGYLLRLAAKLKIRSAVEWANTFLKETDEKLVLFAHHQKAIECLKRRVNAKSVVIDGSVTSRHRQLAVEQFQKDPKTRVCIGNIRAAGVGITLTAASTLAFVELYWNPAAILQAEARIDRIGQKNTSWIWYLVAGGTIEERLCRILQDKQEVISSVLDGGPLPTDLNIYEELLTELESEAA
jgi:SWI/SNF-related matrix-associated actin-dependent regulator 1 of chromatin subfamily A